ncbi:hypothetical protein BV20DRAFT_1054830 [Pilatotrama ljubarskyi]|nr:hypothetical protein BV20DRAFT_1054830 [Pilatotrama ljubarskyi]
MPHSLVVARLDPYSSAFWLTRFGQLTARKIHTAPFWALRVALVDEEKVDKPIMNPRLLYVVSTEPSPINIPGSSFTLGPRLALDSKRLQGADAQLTTTYPLHSFEDVIDWPLYVHTVPRLKIHYPNEPLATIYYELDKPSLLKFKYAASNNTAPARDYYYREVRPRRAWIPTESAPREWSSFSGGHHHRYILGGANAPRAYCFEFVDDYFPCLESPSIIYEEIYLFHQVCKDYRWDGVVDTIDWVVARRQQGTKPEDNPGATKAPSPLDAYRNYPLRSTAMELFSLSSPYSHIPVEPVEDLPFNWEGRDPFSLLSTASDYPFLPDTFKFLREIFRDIPLGRPRIIVLDIFGVILDRESAVRRALSTWSPFVRRRVSLDKILSRYVECEAFAERAHDASAVSLATIVHDALLTLAKKLDVAPDIRAKLVASTLPIILEPQPYADVCDAIDTLKAAEFTLMYLPPHSPETLTDLRRVLPPNILEDSVISPTAPSVHFASSEASWKCLHALGANHLPGLREDEILVASAGIGRILAPAQGSRLATAHVRRPDNREASVNFFVSTFAESNPKPSVVVDSLGALSQLLIAKAA